MYTIAVTGGIGSGKTAVTDYLAIKGFKIIDTDKMSHDITAPGGKSIPYIRDHFGNEYICEDGSLNRAKMRSLVYSNPEMMKVLEEGTTKVIIQDTNDIIEECKTSGDSAVFVAIPLLFEKGNTSDYDLIWSVLADEKTRIERIKARDNFTEEMIHNIFSIQSSDETRIAKSTDIIYNNGSLDSLYSQIDDLLDKYNLK